MIVSLLLFFSFFPISFSSDNVNVRRHVQLVDVAFNRIYNKILDRDWISARPFVTEAARNHVGVQFKVSDLTFL